ncbi:RNase H domain-containing protein [Trichonephila clavipes]|nr:RNase H domain-containing protein [Trichonephila clavipes]
MSSCWWGVELKRMRYQIRCWTHHLDEVQNYEVHHQLALCSFLKQTARCPANPCSLSNIFKDLNPCLQRKTPTFTTKKIPDEKYFSTMDKLNLLKILALITLQHLQTSTFGAAIAGNSSGTRFLEVPLENVINWKPDFAYLTDSKLNYSSYSTHNDIHLQWIPSHVDLYFNDLADELAKEGSNDPIDSSDLLTYNEINSKEKTDYNRTWKTPPSHDWYQQNGLGAALELKDDRKLQTAITRLISGHTRGPTFVQGQNTFPVCLKCNVHQASPEHLLYRALPV